MGKKTYPKPDQATVDRLAKDASERRGFKVCGAWRPRAGDVCSQPPAKGRNRCRWHGGASPRGWEHPSTKAGLFSKYASPRLGEQIEALLGDDEMLSLRSDIALTTSRLQELVGSADALRLSALATDLEDLVRRLREAKRKDQAAILAELVGTVESSVDDVRLWAEIFNVQEVRAKLVEKEAKRAKDLKQMITAERAAALISYIEASILRATSTLDDRSRDHVRQRVSDDLRAYARGAIVASA